MRVTALADDILRVRAASAEKLYILAAEQVAIH
jgi:hypothetical protein